MAVDVAAENELGGRWREERFSEVLYVLLVGELGRESEDGTDDCQM